MATKFRFAVNDDLPRTLSGDAPLSKGLVRKLTTPAVLPLACRRPELARFSPAQTVRLESCARPHQLLVAQVTHVSLTMQSANALTEESPHAPT